MLHLPGAPRSCHEQGCQEDGLINIAASRPHPPTQLPAMEKNNNKNNPQNQHSKPERFLLFLAKPSGEPAAIWMCSPLATLGSLQRVQMLAHLK